MKQINILGIETRFGYRTFELFEGDISKLDRRVDVIIISAFANGYTPISGSVICSLEENCGIKILQISQNPEFDFRKP